MPCGDRLERRRHPDEVAAEHAGHPDLGRGLVVRAGELHVHALAERGVDLVRERAQPRRVQVGQVDERRALERRGRREVDVVADQHGRARAPGGVEAAAAVGQHDGRRAGRRRGAHAVHDAPHAAALVQVRARAEHERVLAGRLDAHGADDAAVPDDRRGREARGRRCSGSPRRSRPAGPRRRPSPSRARARRRAARTPVASAR